MKIIETKAFPCPLPQQEENVRDFILQMRGKYKHLQLSMRVAIPNEINSKSKKYNQKRKGEADKSADTLKLLIKFAKKNNCPFTVIEYHDGDEFIIKVVSEGTSKNPLDRINPLAKKVKGLVDNIKIFPEDEDEESEDDSNDNTTSESPKQVKNQSQNNPKQEKNRESNKDKNFKYILSETIKNKLNDEIIEDLVEKNRTAMKSNQIKNCILQKITITPLTTDKKDLSQLEAFLKNNHDKRDSKFYLERLLSEVAPNTNRYFDIDDVIITDNQDNAHEHRENPYSNVMNDDNDEANNEKEKWKIELDYQFDWITFSGETSNPLPTTERESLDLLMIIHDKDSMQEGNERKAPSLKFTLGRKAHTSKADIQVHTLTKDCSREQLEIRKIGQQWKMKNIGSKNVFIIDSNRPLKPEDECNISHQMSVQLGTFQPQGEEYDKYPLVEFNTRSKLLESEATDPEATRKSVLQSEATDPEVMNN